MAFKIDEVTSCHQNIPTLLIKFRPLSLIKELIHQPAISRSNSAVRFLYLYNSSSDMAELVTKGGDNKTIERPYRMDERGVECGFTWGGKQIK